MEKDQIKNNVKNWVQEVVLKQNLCPYAHDVWNRGQYEIIVSPDTDFKRRMDLVLSYLQEKKSDLKSFGTGLLVFPEVKENFIRFYNFHAMVDEELKARNLEGDFQIVSFHPEFRFEGEKKSSKGNFVNRSPYPLLHILKSSDVTDVIERVGESAGVEVAMRNKEFLEGLTEDDFENKINKFITPFWNKDHEN
ncbi:MAG: DUF1415 domain-containing protein [Halobacteriovoraceae bacterium]|nr:DUF1415 domain-containing protein [Halobacteriovoraceae bacterium]